MSSGASGTGIRDFYNDYVRTVFPDRRQPSGAVWAHPGDEWVSADVRDATFAWIMQAAPVDLQSIVEYGPGSGKYTELLLRSTSARLTSFEISEAFIEALCNRCGSELRNRLRIILIDWTDNEGLVRSLGDEIGHIDFVVSVDALWMMDFQSAFVYLLSAAVMLRRGGKLAVNFADGIGDSGFQRMVRDAGRHSAFSYAPCTRFYWITSHLLEDLLPRLGFGNLSIRHGPAGGLDIARLYVSAELVDPEIAAKLANALVPAGDSTNRYTEVPTIDERPECAAESSRRDPTIR